MLIHELQRSLLFLPRQAPSELTSEAAFTPQP